MTSPEGSDLEARVGRLEDEIVLLRSRVERAGENAAAARILAGGADTDVADVRTELRAHRQSLNALRETQVEMAGQLAVVSERMDDMNARMETGFATVNTGMAQIVALLEGMGGAE